MVVSSGTPGVGLELEQAGMLKSRPPNAAPVSHRHRYRLLTTATPVWRSREAANEQVLTSDKGVERMDHPFIAKLDDTHFPAFDDEDVPTDTRGLPDAFPDATRVDTPPTLRSVLVAKTERAAQLLDWYTPYTVNESAVAWSYTQAPGNLDVSKSIRGDLTRGFSATRRVDLGLLPPDSLDAR